METNETKQLKNMTNSELADEIIAAINDIKQSYHKYGEVVITISGGNVKHIDVRKPWKQDI